MPDIPTEALEAARADFWLLCEPPREPLDELVRARINRAFSIIGESLLTAGRAQAAADIRDAPYPDPSPCIPAWHAGYTEATETAAKIAEGNDHA